MTTDIASYLATRDQTPAAAIAHRDVPRNTILQGDCLQILPQLAAGSVDFVLTDPPYLASTIAVATDAVFPTMTTTHG